MTKDKKRHADRQISVPLLNIPPLAVTLYYSVIANPFSMHFSGLNNYAEMIGAQYYDGSYEETLAISKSARK